MNIHTLSGLSCFWNTYYTVQNLRDSTVNDNFSKQIILISNPCFRRQNIHFFSFLDINQISQISSHLNYCLSRHPISKFKPIELTGYLNHLLLLSTISPISCSLSGDGRSNYTCISFRVSVYYKPLKKTGFQSFLDWRQTPLSLLRL